jgi:ParB-like chromosome segregation protein Spo0J
MKFHEYANIYRMLPDAELQKLAKDIKEKGQILPITSYEGKILDGRNRYKACEIAKVDPRIEEYTGDDPIGLIASLNDHRRHDTDTERALVGERMASLMHGGTGANQYKSADSPRGLSAKPAVTMERAAELAGTSLSQIKRVRKAKRDGIPELVEMLESGEITAATADHVASLPAEDQREAVSRGVHGVKEAAKKLKATKKKSANLFPPEESLEASQWTPQTNGCDGSAKTGEDSPEPEPGVALVYARTALNALNKIPKRDPSRKKAISMIAEWLENNTK